VSLSSNARIKGSVQVGPNSNPNQVIYLGSNGQITGAKTAMPQAMALPTLTAPTGLGASTGNLTYASNQQATVSGNLHVNNLKLSSNSKMKISGNVTILAEGYLSISSNSGIEVLPNSTLKMYVKGAMTFSSNAATAIDGTNLSSATFYNLGTNTVSLSSNAVVKGVIVSPTAPVSLSSNAQVFGAVMASQLNLSSNAAVHEDKRITNQVDRVSLPGSGSSKPRPDSWNRIVQ
jgi:prolyl oligopeptidase PreP (S9A serine peptidase family)